jgi:hypothetical protein
MNHVLDWIIGASGSGFDGKTAQCLYFRSSSMTEEDISTLKLPEVCFHTTYAFTHPATVDYVSWLLL